MTIRIPATLKLTVPLILLGFAAILSTVNMLYHVPQAERAAEEDSRKRLAQEMSRLQSTLEYLLLKGDFAAAQREIAVLAHNHEVTFAALTDDRNTVVEATRRASMGLPIATVLPQFDLGQAAMAVRERRAGMTVDSRGDELLGYAGVLMGGEHDELRPTRTGSLFLAYDLKRYKAEARAQVLKQSLYWAGWVTALALAMWLVFHFLLTRRTARLVHAAEELAEGRLSARSGLRGGDELGRLSRAFDAMAGAIAERYRRAQALGRGAAGVGGELPGDIRRRRGCDLRHRHRDRGNRRCQPQGLCRVRLQPRGVPATRIWASSAPACIPTRTKARWVSLPARSPASSCRSNGTPRPRMGGCAGMRCSASA